MQHLTVKAPGRVCLFGDHQDYLKLPIIACAINRYIEVSGTKNEQNIFSISFPDTATSKKLCFRESALRPAPGDHLAAGIKVVQKLNCKINQGYDITIKGDIPINAGLSSSSAMLVAWIKWLLKTFGSTSKITSELIAQLAFEAEVIEQNAPGGKMDQYTCAIGDVLYLETDENSFYKSIKTPLEGLIIGASGIPKDTLGLLSKVKNNVHKALAIVHKNNKDFILSQATLIDVEKYKNILPTELYPYFSAAVQNHHITQNALKTFKKNSLDLDFLGQLMNHHHNILKEDLQITVPKIDHMITAALNAGAYGAKIVGSGGGGSICALAPKGKELEIINAILSAGAVDATLVNVSKGVHIA